MKRLLYVAVFTVIVVIAALFLFIDPGSTTPKNTEESKPVDSIAASDVSTKNEQIVVGGMPDGSAVGMVSLKLRLPSPMFKGTPKDAKSKNLEPPLNGERPPVMVPADVVNLAEGKEVTGSDMEPVLGDLAMVTDGDKEGADGSYVELGPMKQYIQIDLGKVAQIFAVVIWHYHSEACVYRDVIVQVADDPDFIVNVRTVFNNDHDNSSGLGVGKDKEYYETNKGRPIGVKGEKARYVRLYSNGSTSSEMNHYIEVEVYGK